MFAAVIVAETVSERFKRGKGFDVGGNIFGRQGYAEPFILRLSGGNDGALRTLAVPTIDTTRYANLWDVDLRVSKDIKLSDAFSMGGPFSINLAADVFNVLNTNTVLSRTRQVGTSFGLANEILSPRILRVTASFKF